MRYAFFYLILLTVNLYLAQMTPSYGQQMSLNSKAIIHISQEGLSTTIPVKAYIFQIFPAFDGSEISDSLSVTRKQVWLSCPIKTTQNGHLFIKEDKLKLLLIPGDTVHLYIQPSTSLNTSFRYSFSGKTKQEQAYYLAKKQHFLIDPDQLGVNVGINAENLNQFQTYLDSLTQVETHFWKHYQPQHSLPTWFARFESNAIRYSDARLRLYMSWYQIDFQRKKQRIPIHYFKFLNGLPLINKQAQYQFEYLNFLHEYITWQLKEKGKPIQSTPPKLYYPAFYGLCKQALGPDLGAFMKLWEISGQAKDNPERTKTQLPHYRAPAQYSYLVKYLVERSQQKQLVLQAGDKAPLFYLTDSQDSLVSLRQFQGQVVYLCFWFATCGGCKVEFPYENQLVSLFKRDSVKIVSICTHTAHDEWRAMSKRVGLETINLYANETWQKKLEHAYAINAYPHYVLIGADGQIIENFATRPSQNAAAKIKNALEAINSK